MSATIQTRVTAMETEMAAIKERLAPIEERIAPIESQDPSAIIAALTERLAALELTVKAAPAAAAPKPRGRPPKAKVAAEGVSAAAEAPPADAPGPDHYRLSSYDESLCMARKLKPSGQDRHWSPVVYHETQCTSKPVEGESGEGLCTSCCSLRDKEMEAGKLKHWNGRVDEDPADDALLTVSVHMLGTEWGKKCKWNTEASPVKSTAKGGASAEDKAAAKAAKDAEKEAAKAAKAAEKEAAKAAKAAEKEAASAAKKEAKKAEKAEKPEKPASAKAEKPKKDKDKDAKAPAAAVAATEEAPAGGDYTMLLIDGELRVTKNGNVYELDELTQLPGDFLGRLIGTTEAPAIDGDADEVVESDAE